MRFRDGFILCVKASGKIFVLEWLGQLFECFDRILSEFSMNKMFQGSSLVEWLNCLSLKSYDSWNQTERMKVWKYGLSFIYIRLFWMKKIRDTVGIRELDTNFLLYVQFQTHEFFIFNLAFPRNNICSTINFLFAIPIVAEHPVRYCR